MPAPTTPYYALRRQGYLHDDAVDLLRARKSGLALRGPAAEAWLERREIERALQQAAPVQSRVADQ